MYYVAVYDVDARRVGRMLKIFRKYLRWVQNSVFEGELTASQVGRLKAEAEALMDGSDSVILWAMRDRHYMERETLGPEPGETSRML